MTEYAQLMARPVAGHGFCRQASARRPAYGWQQPPDARNRTGLWVELPPNVRERASL